MDGENLEDAQEYSIGSGFDARPYHYRSGWKSTGYFDDYVFKRFSWRAP
jgi:hypothetical protein